MGEEQTKTLAAWIQAQEKASTRGQQTAERRLLLWHTNFLTAAIVAAFACAVPARVLVVLVVWLVAAAVLAALLLWARRQCRPVLQDSQATARGEVT